MPNLVQRWPWGKGQRVKVKFIKTEGKNVWTGEGMGWEDGRNQYHICQRTQRCFWYDGPVQM